MPHADRALARLCLGDLPGAFADCEKALAADPNYIWARYYRAMVHYVGGNFPKAADDFAANGGNDTLAGNGGNSSTGSCRSISCVA